MPYRYILIIDNSIIKQGGRMKNLRLIILALMLVSVLVFLGCGDDDDLYGDDPAQNTIKVPGATLKDKLQWITSNAERSNTYIIEVENDTEYVDSYIFPGFLTREHRITYQLIGIGDKKTIELDDGSLSLFTINEGVMLILENIILKGNKPDGYLVVVNGGTLITKNGVKITGKKNGVYINYRNSAYGTFTMDGGEISGNYDRGVYIVNGTFTMNGGKICGNGGGVYVSSNGFFTMNGGEISGNDSTNSSYSSGGGVYVSSFSQYTQPYFKKTGGIITGYSSDTVNGNYANHGHAVYVSGGNYRNYMRFKDTTAGEGDNLTHISNTSPPTISGAWDN